MAEVHACPECGAPLPAGAPEAPCSACLLKLGMQSWARREEAGDEGGRDSGPTRAMRRPFAAPSPAELADRFPQLEIIELRGQGGMGAVYKARQKSLDRLVALKIINPEAADDPGFASRFAREAKALARLNHPHIVGVHDFGEADGLFYLVMEYVDGVDLRTLISGGKLQPGEALALVPQICDALQYAHEEGIVHRDIKPENILVDKRGRVKIADFGLAKLLRLSAVEMTLTHTRQVVGTFHYMAPEQFERPGEVDHRVDIYALGVVFYEMLTGTLPVGRFDLPSQRCAVDARLDDVVLRALEREPDRRYQHASDVKTDVESLDAFPKKAPPGRVSPPSAVSQQQVELEEVREHLAMPAIGLMVYGALGLAASVITWIVFSFLHISGVEEMRSFDLWMTFGCCLGGGILAVIVIRTGAAMRSLTSYDFAVAGAIVTLLTFPTPFTWLFAIPLGVWSLHLLRQPPIRKAFALQRRLWREDPRAAARMAVRQKLAAPAWGLIVCGVLVILFPVIFLLTLNLGDRRSIFPILIIAVPGIPMLLGGISLLRLGPYEAAVLGAGAALLPCGPAWLISFPLGLASLYLLKKPHVNSEFARWFQEESTGEAKQEGNAGQTPLTKSPAGRNLQAAAAVELQEEWRPQPGFAESKYAGGLPYQPFSEIAREVARDAVRLPATLMAVAGTFSLLFTPVLGIVAAIRIIRDPMPEGRLLVLLAAVSAAVSLSLLAAAAQMVGGLLMRRLESRWLALLAALAAILPLNISWLIGLPAGVWVLASLHRRDVKQAFAEQANRWEDLAPSLERAARLLKGTAGLHLAFLPLAWATYLVTPLAGAPWPTIALGIATVLVLLASMIVLLGAGRLGRGESWSWSFTAAVVALFPLTPAVLLGLPAGLYAISVLIRPGVAAWFITPGKPVDTPLEAPAPL
jgi:predicted Ser/Thr protein kinase